MSEYSHLANSLHVDSLGFLGLNSFGVQISRSVEECLAHEGKPVKSAFEFDFLSHGNLAFTGISLKGVIRSTDLLQAQMLSVVETSPQSDKQSVIFCGDLFNFFLAKRLVDSSLESASSSDTLCWEYLSSLDNLRGFPGHQVILCSSSRDLMAKTLQVSRSLFPEHNSAFDHIKAQKMQASLLADHRLVQPILQISSPKVKRAVEILGLDAESPSNVLRCLWAIREQLSTTQ